MVNSGDLLRDGNSNNGKIDLLEIGRWSECSGVHLKDFKCKF